MVILPMVGQYRRMLQRNLLYTGITRTTELLILLGEPQAFYQSVQNESANRKTSLVTRLTEKPLATIEETESDYPLLKEEKKTTTPTKMTETSLFSEESQRLPQYLTVEVIEQQVIDPLIGMNGLTPYDLINT